MKETETRLNNKHIRMRRNDKRKGRAWNPLKSILRLSAHELRSCGRVLREEFIADVYLSFVFTILRIND